MTKCSSQHKEETTHLSKIPPKKRYTGLDPELQGKI